LLSRKSDKSTTGLLSTTSSIRTFRADEEQLRRYASASSPASKDAAVVTTASVKQENKRHNNTTAMPMHNAMSRNEKKKINAKQESRKLLSLTNALLQANNSSSQCWDEILRKEELTLSSLLTKWKSTLKAVHLQEKRKSRSNMNYQPPEDSLLLGSVESIHRLVLAILDDDPQTFSLYQQYFAVQVGISAWARIVDMEPRNEEPAWRSEHLFQALPMPPPFVSSSSVQEDGSSSSSSLDNLANFIRIRRLLYQALLLCWSRTKTVQAPQRTRYWLERMKKEQEDLAISDFVDIDCYNRVMAAYAHQGKLDQVQEISNEITRLEMEGKLAVDAVSYDLLVEAYQRYPASDEESRLRMASAAHVIWLELFSKYDATKDIKLKPLAVTLGRILSLNKNDPVKARQILYHALEFEESHREEFLRSDVIDGPYLVDSTSIRMLMHAFVKLNRVEDAEELLKLSIEKHDAGYSHLEPTGNAVEIIMSGYAQRCEPDHDCIRSGTSSAMESLAQVERMMQVMEDRLKFDRKVDISSVMYNILMTSYLKTEAKIDKVKKIQGTIDKMAELALRYQRPDLGPDVGSFTILIQALTQQKQPSFEKIDHILLMMQTSPRREARPNYVTISILVQSYLLTSDARFMDRAVSLLDKTTLVDTATFNHILLAYEQHGRAREALTLLDRMIKESKASKNYACRPNATSYSRCLWAIAKSNMPEKWKTAKLLIERMLQSYNDGDRHCEPNNHVVVALLRVLRDSVEPVDKVKEARDIMGKLDIRVLDTTSLEAFITTCSKAVGKREYLKDAFMAAYQAFNDFRKPRNSEVYIAMLTACNELLQDPEQRKNAIAKLFQHCAASGLVSEQVLRALWKMCPPDDYTNLTLQDATRVPIVQLIPEAWKRHVT